MTATEVRIRTVFREIFIDDADAADIRRAAGELPIRHAELRRCEAAYPSSAESKSRLSFAGTEIGGARILFEDARVIEIRLTRAAADVCRAG